MALAAQKDAHASIPVARIRRADPSSPHVDRLLADLVLPRDLDDRGSIGFAQDRDHLFFSKPDFLHQLLASSAGAIVSSYDWSEKSGQVISTIRNQRVLAEPVSP